MPGNSLSLGNPRDITNPGDDAIHMELPFTVRPVEQLPGKDAASSHRLRIHLSDSRRSTWQLTKEQARRVMLSLGLGHVLRVLRERQPSELEELFINHATFPGECPVSPADISDLPKEPIEIERAKKPIGF